MTTYNLDIAMLWLTRISGLALLAALAGCSNAALEEAVGTPGSSEILVERTGSGISVQNNAGRPLLNIRLVIQPDGSAPFISTLPTLDPGAKREVRFAEFRTEDGALFEPGYFAPREVSVAARDTLGNNYDVSMPWER